MLALERQTQRKAQKPTTLGQSTGTWFPVNIYIIYMSSPSTFPNHLWDLPSFSEHAVKDLPCLQILPNMELPEKFVCE